MQVKVKLFATLRNNREKEQILDMPGETDISYALKLLGISENDAAILFINGCGARINSTLKNNDILSIFPPLGGG